MNAIEKNWRGKALRLHPDKTGKFWTPQLTERLRRLFDYYNATQEHLLKCWATYILPTVRSASLSYFLTQDTKEFAVEIAWEATDHLSTCIQYRDDDSGVDYEMLVEEGQGQVVFTADDENCECLFSDRFCGFTIFHIGPVGRLRNVESQVEIIVGEVPRELREAHMLVQNAKTESSKRRRTCSVALDKRAVPWRSNHGRYQGRRRQVCLYHDPANGWFCRYRKTCQLDHIDTRTKKGARRWAGLMAALARVRGDD